MKKRSLIFFFFISSFITVFLSSCEDDNYFDIGKGWVDTNFKLVYIDTITPLLKTVKIDSVPTYNKSTILLGKYNDVNTITGELLTGKTTAASYIEITKPSSFEDIDVNNTVFDSLVIEMRFNRFYVGDTLKNMHLFVYQLKAPMELDVETGSEVYYNTMSFPTESTPLAEVTFPIRPSNTDANQTAPTGESLEPVRIKLPYSLGKEMFEKIRDKEVEFDDNKQFVDYFRGLALIPGNMNTIAGFKCDTTFKLNLHYHIKEEFKIEKVISFSASTKNQFNHIVTDRTGTGLVDFTAMEKEIDSRLTNNVSFIQAGDGLYTRVEFPHLGEIKLLSEYGAVEAAELRIYPVIGTFGDLYNLPETLNIYYSTGESESLLYNSRNQQQNGNLKIDYQFPDSTYYNFDVTSFIQNQMGAKEDSKMTLTLKLSDDETKTTLKRLVIGDAYKKTEIGDQAIYNRIKLNLIYNMYNDN